MSDSDPESIATHTQKIGIILPPPDIKIIVDKTASFVANYGPEFEKYIIVSNAGNPKFNFLNGSDPCHPYYQHQLAEFRESSQSSHATEKTDPSAKLRPVKKILDPPEPEQYTIQLPEGITDEELDIIKLTAQFVARNGKSFLTELTSRETNNPHFHFLKPTHSMFMLFASLTDTYSKLLIPPKWLNDKLKKSVTDMTTVVERCLHRLEWAQSQEQARQMEKDEIEQERVINEDNRGLEMIDWNDFVVVESIDFADDEDDDLPVLTTLDEVIRKSKKLKGKEENNVVETIREENVSWMSILKKYKTPEERLAAFKGQLANTVVSPITGELITVNEMSTHMRFSLIDPKYKEQKERMFAKIGETTLAQHDEISRNLVGLARTRHDILGTTEEEVSNAQHSTVTPVYPQPPPLPPTPPMRYSQQPPDMMDRIALPMGCKLQSVFVNRFTPIETVPFIPQHGMPIFPLPEEPEPKRRRLDESLLVPEAQFLAQHPGPVHIRVSVPDVDEENLKGQILEITIESLSENVGSLKEKIAREIRLPANRQKLSGNAGFLKDNMSLAYYNIGEGEMIFLSLRERSGRKR